MRSIILLFFLITTSNHLIFGQEFSVADFPDKSETEIRSTIRLWIADHYTSAKEVIQIDEPGKIVGKGLTLLNTTVAGYQVNYKLNFSMEFDTKEARYRFRIKDIMLSTNSFSAPIEKWHVANEENKKMISRQKGMAKKTMEESTAGIDEAINKANLFLENLNKSILSIPTKEADTGDW